jgi:hypothetical protein
MFPLIAYVRIKTDKNSWKYLDKFYRVCNSQEEWDATVAEIEALMEKQTKPSKNGDIIDLGDCHHMDSLDDQKSYLDE